MTIDQFTTSVRSLDFHTISTNHLPFAINLSLSTLEMNIKMVFAVIPFGGDEILQEILMKLIVT